MMRIHHSSLHLRKHYSCGKRDEVTRETTITDSHHLRYVLFLCCPVYAFLDHALYPLAC